MAVDVLHSTFYLARCKKGWCMDPDFKDTKKFKIMYISY